MRTTRAATSASGDGSNRSQDDPLLRMTDLAVDTGIEDLATNIDHYLYGHPKVEDRD